MIIYIARRYFFTVLVFTALFALLPLAVGAGSLLEILPSAVFWGGLVAVLVVYWNFRRRNLWVLYDNLRLPKFVLLGVLMGCLQFLNIFLMFHLWT